jgi:purine nucleosidase
VNVDATNAAGKSDLPLTREKVLLIHDGAIDEYMATVLVLKMPNVDLQAIIVVAGNCLPEIGMQTAWKIQSYLDRTDVPLFLSEARAFNPFPWDYRQDCIRQANVGALQRYGPNKDWPPYPPAEPWLRKYFQNVQEKVTVLCLCPLTPLADLLHEMPEAQYKIERLVWMGGALDVPGNLDPATIPSLVANPYAEWNVFWDPGAVEFIFRATKFPIFLFPLDITNHAKVSADFLGRLFAKSKVYRLADLAYQSYRAVTGDFYCMWDTTAAAYLDFPALFGPPQEMQIAVETLGANAGTIKLVREGRTVQSVTSFTDLNGFYDYFVNRFSADR